MDAVILTGGKGLRLGKVSKKTPKVLIKIDKKPILEHQINFLEKNNIKNIWILSGHLGQKIDYFLNKIKNRKININHLIEDSPLGTAGAIKTLEGKITTDFLVISGDVMFDIDLESFINFHNNKKDSIATLCVHPNDHPFDSDLIDIDTDGKVKKLLIRKGKTQPKNRVFRNLANASIYTFNPKIFKYIQKNRKCDLEKNIFPKILESKQNIYAYNTAEYIKDMGTPKRLKIVREDYQSGKIARQNKKNKQKAIFLDRDGTLNMQDGIDDVRFNDFKLFPFTIDAIKKINQSNYLVIVITNQPAIAKGFISEEEIELIHKKLETELGGKGVIINGIYYCPHHPERGFRDEVKKLKIKCNCRKPDIGLIKKAAGDFNIDLKNSYFVGDTTIDAKTAQNAGIKFIGVKTGFGLTDQKFQICKPILIKKNLLSAINYISRFKEPSNSLS